MGDERSIYCEKGCVNHEPHNSPVGCRPDPKASEGEHCICGKPLNHREACLPDRPASECNECSKWKKFADDFRDAGTETIQKELMERMPELERHKAFDLAVSIRDAIATFPSPPINKPTASEGDPIAMHSECGTNHADGPCPDRPASESRKCTHLADCPECRVLQDAHMDKILHKPTVSEGWEVWGYGKIYRSNRIPPFKKFYEAEVPGSIPLIRQSDADDMVASVRTSVRHYEGLWKVACDDLRQSDSRTRTLVEGVEKKIDQFDERRALQKTGSPEWEENRIAADALRTLIDREGEK